MLVPKLRLMYYLEKKIIVPASVNECWDFFSSPSNLSKITPKEMDFVITSNTEVGKMYPGMFITYTVRPLFGIKMKWVTEITFVEQGKYFIDEQRVGPYKIWHHEHHFEEVEQGTLMTDKIYYLPPFGIFGKLAQPMIVKPQLKKIFDHREKMVKELFGEVAVSA